MSLQQLNDKFTTLDSILTSDKKLNSLISRLELFRHLNIYKEVMDKTHILDKFDGIQFQNRIHFLLGNAKIEHCNSCRKEYIQFNNTFTRFALCNHKQRYTLRSRNNMMTLRKQHFKDFNDSLSYKNLMCSETEFNSLLDEMISKKENFNFLVTKNSKFYHDLVLKTSDVIPIDTHRLRISQRIYFAYHKIFNSNDIPICKYCGINHSVFVNRTHGFKEYCASCSLQKSNQTRHDKYEKQIDEYVDEKRFEVVHYPNTLNSDTLKIRCKKCNHVTSIMINNGRLKLLSEFLMCSSCEKIIGSKLEHEVAEYIKTIYKGNIVHGGSKSRSIIHPLELDFFFPEKNVAIEVNGTYWHSSTDDNDDVNKKRHIQKFNECKKKRIALLQLFEDTWKLKNDLSKRYIRFLIGCEQFSGIEYRNIQVKEISSKDSYNFQIMNDIRGGLKSKINVGCFNGDKLIATASCRFSKHINMISIHRLSFIEMSKDLRHICTNKLLDHISKCFSDSNISIIFDNLYPELIDINEFAVFSMKNIKKQQMCYCKGCQRYSHTTHNQFIAMISDYDNLKTFNENMKQNGFRCVYDAGKTIYTMIRHI